MKDILTAQVQMAPQVYESEAKYQPLYNQLQAQQQASQAQVALDIAKKTYPQIADLEATYTGANRAAELNQLQTSLPQYQAAFVGLTPGYQQALQATGQLAQQSMQQSLQAPKLTAFEAAVTKPTTGGIVGQVGQYTPANIAAAAGTPQDTGLLKAVTSASTAAATAGAVPGAAAVGAASPISSVATTAGAVPSSVYAAKAQTAADALKLAGEVPTAANIANAQTAQAALTAAGAVPTADQLFAFQKPEAAAALAGLSPASSGLAGMQTAAQAAETAGQVPTAQNLGKVAGPQLASNIENINQATVDQYIAAQPGLGQIATGLSQRAQEELAAGRRLTAEETRMAEQAARSAYAARGMALGPQAIAAEVLNRADVANQRYQQRLMNAQQMAGSLQGIYAPAMAQALERQQLGIQYGLGVQQQAFGQAQTRDLMAQQLQAQRYAQAMGTQSTGFGQQATTAQLEAALQAQRYGQRMSTQAAGFGQQAQALGLSGQLQQQRFGQLSATQQAGFAQAQARDAMAQQQQAQRYAQLMGAQETGFGQAQALDVAAQQQQAQRFAQAIGVQTAGFEQAKAQDLLAQQTQAQRYAQAMGTQGAAFGQAATQEELAQNIQQQKYAQAMGIQGLLQGAQAQQFEQAMNREQLGAATQQAEFQQALQRSQAEQARLQGATAIRAGQAQLGAGAMGQLQSAQAPILQAFYKQPILQGQEGQAQSMGLAMQQQAGPQYFNPESQTGMGSIYGAYNAQMGLAGAQAQANAAAKAGRSSMMGSLGGALIGNVGKMFSAGAALCWVAREVYGNENPKWLEFREWLLGNADDDFLNAYIQHGPKVAEFISDKPELKNMIRSWMDSKIS